MWEKTQAWILCLHIVYISGSWSLERQPAEALGSYCWWPRNSPEHTYPMFLHLFFEWALEDLNYSFNKQLISISEVCFFLVCVPTWGPGERECSLSSVLLWWDLADTPAGCGTASPDWSHCSLPSDGSQHTVTWKCMQTIFYIYILIYCVLFPSLSILDFLNVQCMLLCCAKYEDAQLLLFFEDKKLILWVHCLYRQCFPTVKAPTRGPCCIPHTSRIPLRGA